MYIKECILVAVAGLVGVISADASYGHAVHPHHQVHHPHPHKPVHPQPYKAVHPHPHPHAPTYHKARPYEFSYDVNDAYHGTNFGHSESSDGNAVQGSYSVDLPDGRKQTVNYNANHHTGYLADVTYKGEAKFPAYHAPVHHAPAYHAPAVHHAPTYHPKPVHHAPSYHPAPVHHRPHVPSYH